MSISQKHGHRAARAMKQRGIGGVIVHASFVFQFSLNAPVLRVPYCGADQSCVYPAIFDGFCRAHYTDFKAPYSVTRPRMAAINELINWWNEWRQNNPDFIYAMLGVTGLDHPMAKLGYEEIRQIRRELRAKDSYDSIAEKYCISRSLVSLIASGEYRCGGDTENIGWTSADRAACSRRVVAKRWEASRAERQERKNVRAAKVHEMRQRGLSWREIQRQIGIAYPSLSLEYRKIYGLHALSNEAAGRKRAKMPTYACNPLPEPKSDEGPLEAA